MALDEINDKNILIIPRDTGFNDKEKLELAIKDIVAQGVNVIIGPLNYKDFKIVKKFSNVTFISPSNISPRVENNIISIGISLDSQLIALTKFIKKQKKNKTVIMFPENDYSSFIEAKIKELGLNNYKLFKYSSNPEILTGEIEILTNYSQRKKISKEGKNCLKIKKMNNQLRKWKNWSNFILWEM